MADEELNEYFKLEKSAKKELKNANFRITYYPTCRTCKYLEPGISIEDDDRCKNIKGWDKYGIGTVYPYYVCDRWKDD